jgi:dimethylglycine catabolism A
MWRPPNAIKHTLPVATCPSAETARASRWFQKINVGPIELQERTWVPAMVPWRATPEGFVTPDVLEWYGRFAEGQPGAIVIEATGVRDVPSGPLLRIGHDRFIDGLSKLVETVRRASDGRTRLFVQLIDFLGIRRRPSRENYLGRFLAITERHRSALGLGNAADGVSVSESEVRAALLALREDELTHVLSAREQEALAFGARERVTDTHLPHVRDLPRTLPGAFASAAARAERAGFDGVELHYAHAYTLASLLSATNDRSDGYGGSLDGRMRLPLEVFRATRDAVSKGFSVGCRFLSEECIEGGSTLEDATRFGVAFAEAGFDFLSLSRGGRFEDAKQPKVGETAYPYTGRSGFECMPTVYADAAGPFGRNERAAATIRAAIRGQGLSTPVVLSGGISTFQQAESALAAGAADIVGAARQTLADPDWFRKIRLGHEPAVRRCSFTNYCEALDQRHKQVTCKLWDRQDLHEIELRPSSVSSVSSDGRRRLVAPGWNSDASVKGGGPTPPPVKD